MQRIPIEYAKPGIILHKPVLKDTGIILAGEGLVLTDNILAHLRSAGIKSLVVKGRPLPGLDSGVNLNKILENLPDLFRSHKNNQFMLTVFNMLNQHFIKTIHNQEVARKLEREEDLAEIDKTDNANNC